jgi:branched-chain amino acid transport system ATP-binding protein
MMLEVNDIHTYYGQTHVLWGVSLEVKEASIVALLGRNGMGKTTTMHSIVGLTPPRKGFVRYKGERIESREAFRISRKGLALVPQGRGIFPSLNVRENLTIGARGGNRADAWNLERIYSLFPILQMRSKFYASLLSGGEQQMLAIGRALLTNPDMILLDEPSEGLAPMIVRQISQIIDDLRGKISGILAEQNVKMAMRLADHVYIISKGKIVYEATPRELERNEEIKSMHLGLHSANAIANNAARD